MNTLDRCKVKAISYRKTQQNPNTVLTILFSCDTRYPRTVYLIHPYKSTLGSGTDRHLQFIIPRQQNLTTLQSQFPSFTGYQIRENHPYQCQ